MHPELFHLLSIFEVYVVPSSEAFDGLLQDIWYWLSVDAEPFVCEPAFEHSNLLGFDLHLCPFDVFLKFIQQAIGACFCCS